MNFGKNFPILRLLIVWLWFELTEGSARAATPLEYLHGYGDKAYPVVALTWGLLVVSVAVIVIVAVLVAGAIWRRPGFPLPRPSTQIRIERPEGGLKWIWIGTSVSSLVLLLTVVWTMAVLAKVTVPATRPDLVIEITGHQWWWQARYLSNDSSRVFTTANEIHIPTGVPVRFDLASADVIHSFWVPALSGKTDLIPGQTNETWLEARSPGIYHGQCGEYCGIEHAHMAFLVVAQTPENFRRWWNHQLTSADPPAAGPAKAGLADFSAHCGSCHAVRGTDAEGVLGPDLSHLMTRKTIAAGMLPNDPKDLTRWINDPQALKPGVLMPKPELSGIELTDIRAYLETLD